MFSKEELEGFTLKQLRLIDIKEVEDEAIVQELINQKLEVQDAPANIYRGDAPEIQTPEQEAEYQKVIDERVAKAKAKKTSSKNPNIPDVVPPTEPETSSAAQTDVPKNEDLMDITLSEEDLNNNPELRAQGLKVGDVVQIPAEPAPKTEDTPVDPKVKCQECGSKSTKHKKGCSKAKK